VAERGGAWRDSCAAGWRCGGGGKAAAWALAGAAAGAELQKRWGLLVAGSARDAQAGEAALAACHGQPGRANA
jgi:hypothetical protein